MSETLNIRIGEPGTFKRRLLQAMADYEEGFSVGLEGCGDALLTDYEEDVSRVIASLERQGLEVRSIRQDSRIPILGTRSRVTPPSQRSGLSSSKGSEN